MRTHLVKIKEIISTKTVKEKLAVLNSQNSSSKKILFNDTFIRKTILEKSIKLKIMLIE